MCKLRSTRTGGRGQRAAHTACAVSRTVRPEARPCGSGTRPAKGAQNADVDESAVFSDATSSHFPRLSSHSITALPLPGNWGRRILALNCCCSKLTLSAFSASLVSFLVACTGHGCVGVGHSQSEEDSRRRRRLSLHCRDHSSRVRSLSARASAPQAVMGVAVHPTWLVLFPLASRASRLVAFLCTSQRNRSRSRNRRSSS